MQAVYLLQSTDLAFRVKLAYITFELLSTEFQKLILLFILIFIVTYSYRKILTLTIQQRFSLHAEISNKTNN